MVPGWTEREFKALLDLRQEWTRKQRRDAPPLATRDGPSKVEKLLTAFAVSLMKVIWWFGRHMLQLASLTSQIWALRTFSLLDQIARGGTQ
jgi:hypothetical protein